MKRLIKTLLLLVVTLNSFGQFDATTSLYLLNPMVINPAYAGSREALSLSTFYHKKWTGVDGAPTSVTFSADVPLADQKLGLGLLIVNDRIGVTKENQFVTSYAFRIFMGESTLSFGLGAGVVLTNTAFSDLIVLDPGDEVYLADSRTFAVPNFNFGIYYNNRNYYAGISIPRFLNYSFDYGKNKYVIDNDFSNYNYMLYTGYNLIASPNFGFYPSVLLRYSQIPADNTLQYDLNAQFCLFEKFWLGTSYRNNRSVAALFQFQPNNQLKIAYGYDFETSKLGRYSNGSHMIMLRFDFRYNVDALNPLIF